MLNLKLLNDSELLTNTAHLVSQERELLTAILHHLREIERRRLFAGHSSLFEYAVKNLGYSEDQAWRRVSAMRLLKELPELEPGIASGALNLTHLGLAEALFKREKKSGREFSPETKCQVLTEISGLSTREADKVVLSYATEHESKPDRIQRVSVEKIHLSFEVSEETKSKLDLLRGRLAHKYPNLTLGELLDKLCDITLKATDPGLGPKARKAAANESERTAARGAAETDATPKTKPNQAETRRQVWRRDQGRCTKCKSQHAVEIDHITPRALGGDSSLANLRLLCRQCNQRAAIEQLGLGKMDVHINQRPRPEAGSPAARTNRTGFTCADRGLL